MRRVEGEKRLVVQPLLISGDGEGGRKRQVVAVTGDDGGFQTEVFERDGDGGRETGDAMGRVLSAESRVLRRRRRRRRAITRSKRETNKSHEETQKQEMAARTWHGLC
jgi:hypothetical protein